LGRGATGGYSQVSIQKDNAVRFRQEWRNLDSRAFPEAALNNYTFTWDLRRVIAPTKTRLDSEDTIGAYKPKAQGSKFCIPILAVHENYISVADSFKIKDCRDLADSTLQRTDWAA